ncbi:hypothetical protein [Ferrimicrobium sp.]|jgi:hypothetical protein|uniref:hypothetical protein n=1 Tax=Ferrimicrobium sp. TaxID=2926050 RepID=UPI00262BFAD6|nr:hypothetical protein [Ferrimicrobium sp.]
MILNNTPDPPIESSDETLNTIQLSSFDAAVSNLLTCEQPGQLCFGVSLDPIVEATFIDPIALDTTLVICSTTRSRNAWHSRGVPTFLFQHFVAELAAHPFSPPHPYQKHELQVKALQILRYALAEAGDEPPDSLFDPINLQWKELKTAISRTPAYSDRAKQIFWGNLALAGYREILDKWSDQMVAQPKVLLNYLARQGTTKVLFPDGGLLTQPMVNLIKTLQQNTLRVLVTGDIRTINPLITYKLLEVLDSHVHEIAFSQRPQPILDFLNKIAADTHPGSLPLRSLTLKSPQCTIQTFQERANLVDQLGITLANTPGLTPTSLQQHQHEELEDVRMFNIGDVTGKTILIVTPTKAEARILAGELRNYIDETVKVLGQVELWRNKIEDLCVLFDPLQEHGWTYNPFPFKTQSEKAISIIVEGLWNTADTNHILPQWINKLLVEANSRLDPQPMIEQPTATIPKTRYNTLINAIILQLQQNQRNNSEAESALLKHICDVLFKYANAINSDDTPQQLAKLIEIADQAIDLRLPGAQQEYNGEQPWYPTAKRIRSLGTSRHDIILHLQYRLSARPYSTKLYRSEDKANIYISHIQREGNDRADHVIIARTLPTHMPKHANNNLDRNHDANEYTMIYRAISAALESCQLLLLGERPILPIPLSQQISQLENEIQQAITNQYPHEHIDMLRQWLEEMTAKFTPKYE